MNIRESFQQIYSIDDQATVELDYSGLHPRMLYAEKGIQYEGDLYDLTNELAENNQDQKLRIVSKLALLILINAKKDKNIAGTLAHGVWNDDPALGSYLSKQYKSSKEGDGD